MNIHKRQPHDNQLLRNDFIGIRFLERSKLEHEMTTEPKVFISHKHSDIKIANVLTKHLKEWGVKENCIFQSSDPRHGFTVGGNLKEELQEALQEINLLILLYTYKESDWSYCMWECGIAQGKSTAPSRTVVFQCTDDEPTVFKEEIRVNVNPNGIRSFTQDFHRKPGFIPSLSGEIDVEFAANTPEEVIATRSERLFNEIVEAIPSGTSSSQHLWDFIRLRLNADCMNQIASLCENGGDSKEILKLIETKLELREPRHDGIGNSVDTAVRQFGYAGFQKDLTMQDLVNRWTSQSKRASKAWINDVYQSIERAVTNSPSNAVNSQFKSAREGVDWWFFPVTTRMRTFRDNSIEFDLYLVRVPVNEPVKANTVPSDRPKKTIANANKPPVRKRGTNTRVS